MPPLPYSRLIAVATVASALAACGYAGGDEIEAESAAILARVPVGTSFKDVPAAMAALGFICTTRSRQFTDAKGNMRDTEPHLVCEREQNEWLVCSRRTRAILLQTHGRLTEALVNVGHFCG
jgi:hypothetical protein